MLLQVRHITRYEYAAPVRESLNEARLQPLTNDTQRCLWFDLQITPEPHTSEFTDFYKNPVRHFAIAEAHDFLEVTAESLTETTPPPEPAGHYPPADLSDVRYSREHFDFVGDSRYVARSPELWKCALDLRAGSDDVRQIAMALMHWVYGEFTYSPSATFVQTGALEAFHQRSGVCQDYAHVMLALCRALEIPARYVSGYFWTADLENDPAAGASHAWVEVCLPGYGWFGLDPTHDRAVDETYIKLAVGRDYQDIRPISGTYVGGDVARMQVDVSVTLGEPDLAGV